MIQTTYVSYPQVQLAYVAKLDIILGRDRRRRVGFDEPYL